MLIIKTDKIALTLKLINRIDIKKNLTILIININKINQLIIKISLKFKKLISLKIIKFMTKIMKNTKMNIIKISRCKNKKKIINIKNNQLNKNFIYYNNNNNNNNSNNKLMAMLVNMVMFKKEIMIFLEIITSQFLKADNNLK